MRSKKKTLTNGLRIVTVPMKDNPTVTFLVMVEAGSKYEDKEISGLSHFLEHMCFKGTPKRPHVIDISRELDSIGSQYNAFTAQEFTGYYAKAHKKHFNKILDVISDLYLNPTFPEDEIEKEKGVIVEEINMYEDMPHRHVHDLFLELLYGDQPAGWNIAGTRKRVKAMRRDDFIEYRNKHYVAEGTIVVVAGNIDEKDVQERVSKAFADISTERKHKKKKVVEKQKSPQVLLKNKKTDQTHLVVGVRAFDAFSDKIPALKVLNAILGGGMSSRLFQKLRDEMGVGYYVRSGTDEFTDHGYLGVSTGVDSKRVIEVIEAILEEFKRFKKERVSEEELKKAKDYLTGNMYLGLESSDSLAELYGVREVMGRELDTPQQIAKKIRAVTVDDVMNVAKEIFQNKRLNLAIVGKGTSMEPYKKILKL